VRRSETSPYSVAALTHPGMSGKNNEDRFGVSAFTLDDKAKTPVLLAVLADGIGGHRAGEVAAEIAIETLSRVVAESDADQPREILQAAVLDASQAILAAAQGQEDRHGMGSTCACVWLIGNRLYTVTVGDSRIYLMHNGHVRQISTDHTWVQEALDYGLLQPEEAKNHPNAHVIRRYLGSVKSVVPDFRLRLEDGEKDEPAQQNQGLPLFVGDRILLCSDGLSDLVEQEEIAAAFVEHSQDAAVQTLVDLANQRGGHDNITVISVEIPQEALPRKHRSRWLLWLLLGIIAMGGLVWLLWQGWNRLVTQPLSTQASPTITLQQDMLRTSPPESTPRAYPADTKAYPAVTPSPTSPPLQTLSTPFVTGGATITPWPTNTRAP
jgi:serine/threonine protein phosphatase PrpC